MSLQDKSSESVIASSSSSFVAPSFSLKNRIQRAFWNIAYACLFRPSPRPLHTWRAAILRLFGAQLGIHCHIYPKAVIWAPWNLRCEDYIGVADGAILYNPSPITLCSYSVISQEAYLCGASHDMNHPDFPLISKPITMGKYAWVCARATVQMGVQVGEGAVVALGAVATRNLTPWTVYAGVPARPVKERDRERFLNRPSVDGDKKQ